MLVVILIILRMRFILISILLIILYWRVYFVVDDVCHRFLGSDVSRCITILNLSYATLKQYMKGKDYKTVVFKLLSDGVRRMDLDELKVKFEQFDFGTSALFKRLYINRGSEWTVSDRKRVRSWSCFI